ncbi:MBL fold metallo-hydrolase [Streptomyces muensis]|uniref:MBL fold metallo-hydrolase n=1 Tax=Streptomyces muensis TaxID=1077944 RepID=A0A9X1PYI7_STRM4|nr:MBL fold metallo-hydrolase [Streptomyces muensis]MCF1595358.1 MBL fold metallo-hydrolase [Streptomyces muensis]
MTAAVHEVADGVHAYEQAPGGWCVSNAGIVVGGDGALVVDTLSTIPRARRLAETVDKLATGPARTVVNTHFHGDHAFGNQVFPPGTQIIAHEDMRTAMVTTGLALTGLWPRVDWGDIEVTPPTVTFRDHLTVHVGERRAELLRVGPAHTDHDVVVWLPEERVLFAGDIVMSGVTPFVLFGSVAGTLAALDRLAELEPEVVVAGHGPVAGPEVLDANREYLRWVQRLAAEAADSGLTPLQAAREADLGGYAELLDAERLVANLHRAHEELLGRPPRDAMEIFSELVAYNGGRLPTCLA